MRHDVVEPTLQSGAVWQETPGVPARRRNEVQAAVAHVVGSVSGRDALQAKRKPSCERGLEKGRNTACAVGAKAVD
jgi:hypothetical protein